MGTEIAYLFFILTIMSIVIIRYEELPRHIIVTNFCIMRLCCRMTDNEKYEKLIYLICIQ